MRNRAAAARRNINAVFQTLPGASFTVNGAAAAKDAALLSLGSDLRLANNVSLGLKFDSEIAQTSRSFAGQGALRVVRDSAVEGGRDWFNGLRVRSRSLVQPHPRHARPPVAMRHGIE